MSTVTKPSTRNDLATVLERQAAAAARAARRLEPDFPYQVRPVDWEWAVRRRPATGGGQG